MGETIIKDVIHANGIDISVYSEDLQNDFISLTDIAKKREGEYPGYHQSFEILPVYENYP